MGGIYDIAVEIGSGAMIYLPSFIKMANSETHRQHGERIGILLFFQNKESRLKTK
jgi:hypothetical protein